MNFTFRSYPGHPWIAEWTFEPTGCNTSYRENCSDHFYRTRHTVGQVVPHVRNPEWALQVPVPQNSTINLLANGFCAYFERRRLRCGAEVLVPEPGVLWGRFDQVAAPVLISDRTIEVEEKGAWVESDDSCALLAVQDGTFCLVSKTRIRADAEKTAQTYLTRDLEAYVSAELERRAGAASLFEDMAHHDSLAALCVESMWKALRPAEGRIPHRWSQSSLTDSPRFDLNELSPLALAWSLIDPEIAEELFLCALKIQTNAGALPVHFSPHTTYSVMEAPKPILAKTAEQIWEKTRNPDFLESCIPLLRRHLQWLLHHFDPKRRGIYSWKSRNEPIVPGLFQSELVSVDLAVFLLTELEALNRLRTACPRFSTQGDFFEDERQNLKNSILDLFWNEQEGSFSTAWRQEVSVPLHGFPELTPLLWKSLPQLQRASILERVRESETLPGQQSVLSWGQTSMNDGAFPLLQQFILFQALKSADPHGSVLSDFSRLTIQRFVEWHTLSLESDNTLDINPATAAFIMNVQAMHKYRYHAKGAASGLLFRMLRKARADRSDLMVITGTLLLLFCVHTIYDWRYAPPPLPTLETRMVSAYADQDAAKTLQACLSIIRYYPEQGSRARLLTANLLILNGEYRQAIEFYSRVREEYPDSPGAMIALGLAYQLEGRFEEAEANYYEFCYLFDEIFPDVVARVNAFRMLMREGFRTPPKWQEMYRYQFMHEL